MRLYEVSLQQGETRLLIKTDVPDVLEPVKRATVMARAELITYANAHPDFRWSLEPLQRPIERLSPVVSEMHRASELAGVGPFAAVAGAMAEVAARAAAQAGAKEIVVENGGDLCLHGTGPFLVGIHAGGSPLSQKMGLRILPGESFAGLCTSSGTVGESISFGDADAVAVYCPQSAALADAAATSVCNQVRGPQGLERGITKAREIGGIGVLIIRGDRMAAWGSLPEIVKLERGTDLVLDPKTHSRAL